MDIICKHCNAVYTIADDKVPPKRAAAPCKRCGNRIVIEPLPAAVASPPVAGAPPASGTPGRPSGHDPRILEAFAEVREFDPGRYAISAILSPDRKGRYQTRLNRLKLKILGAVKPTLDRLLKKDEQVMCITGGTAYYPIELLFGNGLFTMLYNRYAVVATNRRLVMVNTNHRMTRASHYLFQLPYTGIRKVSRGLLRTSLSIKRRNGKKRVFTSMKRAFTAELQAFIKPRMTSGKTASFLDAAAENLCPACFEALPTGCPACTACQAVFKTAGKAALRSLLLPGWGDWYLGHRWLGAMELIGSLIVWAIVLSMVAGGGSESIGTAFLILAFYNGFDALLTRHMARKGIMLDSRQPVRRSGSQLAADPA